MQRCHRIEPSRRTGRTGSKVAAVIIGEHGRTDLGRLAGQPGHEWMLCPVPFHRCEHALPDQFGIFRQRYLIRRIGLIGDSGERNPLQHQRYDPVSMLLGIGNGRRARLRHADEVECGQAQMVGEPSDVFGFAHPVRGSGRLAETAAIDRNQGKAVGQRARLHRPHPPVERPAMQQDNRWTLADLLDGQRAAVHLQP